MSQMDAEEVPRVIQMSKKINQFNFTTLRLSSIPEGVEVQTTHVSDKYGDYGLVGAAIFSQVSAFQVMIELNKHSHDNSSTLLFIPRPDGRSTGAGEYDAQLPCSWSRC